MNPVISPTAGITMLPSEDSKPSSPSEKTALSRGDRLLLAFGISWFLLLGAAILLDLFRGLLR